ncbi:GNAT family N-acetyltransferase [candidate division GN15 bacterium]|nr:GNAT family N-acetyltransferase [candidate division GN15 bacterium]
MTPLRVCFQQLTARPRACQSLSPRPGRVWTVVTPVFKLRVKTDDDAGWITEWLSGGGADFIISRGRKLYPARLPGFVAEDPEGKRLGLVTYDIVGEQCEVATLDSFEQWQGIGTELMLRVAESAREAGCKRLWLITTNDNIDAIRFYQRRDLTIAAVHAGAIGESRKLKPSIPEIGLYGIPIRDEIEFEMRL